MSQSAEASTENPPQNSPVLALPAPPPPPDDNHSGGAVTPKIQVGASAVSLLDSMGPTVVAADGTLSRIGNWHEMDERERSRVLRVLGKRNQTRLADLQQAQAQTSGTEPGQDEGGAAGNEAS